MKLLYVSCHAILEYDEVKLFDELGFDVFSTGVYANPNFREGMSRPGIPGLTHYPELERLASTFISSGHDLDQGLIDWADVIVFMHLPEALEKNWPKMKGKRVVFRSIGQCVAHQERILEKLRKEGLQIVRYSPKEEKLPNYAGADAIIRFYKDPAEYRGWRGGTRKLLNITQSIIERAGYVQLAQVNQIADGLELDIYGNGNQGNEDPGKNIGLGPVSYEAQLDLYKQYRAYLYGGTWPAPYTLSFIEAFMSGIPVIAVGKKFVEGGRGLEFYELHDIIQDNFNGFVSDDIDYLNRAAKLLVNDYDKAIRVGLNGRRRAIELFGKDTISNQWRAFYEI